MVCLAEKPSQRLAVCCSVEVVKGRGGFFLVCLMLTSLMTYSAFSSLAVIFSADSRALIVLVAAFSLTPASSSLLRDASIDQYSSGLKALISSSLSITSLRATLCTRPADRPKVTFFHKKGDNSKPTSLSSTRLAC